VRWVPYWLAVVGAAETALAMACGGSRDRTAVSAADSGRGAHDVERITSVGIDSTPPIPTAPLTVQQRRGEALYAAYCWTCHGLYGHGDGPGARGFPEPLPDVTRMASFHSSDEIFALLLAAQRGTDSAEAVWHQLDSAQSHAVAAYIKSFAPPGARGNPAAGRLLYGAFCVHCHGMRGAGDGRLARLLPHRPADLRSVHIAGTPDLLFTAIKTRTPPGHARYMPRWSEAFSDQEIWDLVAYVSILRAGS